MILILSTETDLDTANVIEWLRYYKVTFFRLNDTDLLSGKVCLNYDYSDLLQNSFFQINDQKIFFRDIKIVWLRKYGFLTSYESEIGKHSDLMTYLSSEAKATYLFLKNAFADKKWLCESSTQFNKLNVLLAAQKFDLKIPDSILTNKKHDLLQFLNKHDMIISKPIAETSLCCSNNRYYMLSTAQISNDQIDRIPNIFSTSLLQKYIAKKFEIRTFYLDGKCSSMAIFSQQNSKTKIDFRNYDFEKPNRFVPYKLPSQFERKIDDFMKGIKLNTGSLDFIMPIDSDEYVFLEVNPGGQFGMVTDYCNYNLYESVAVYLIENNF